MDPIAKDLLNWYDQNRRILPWREEPSPYRTWVSEVMLQQTRVDTVLPYFDRFMRRFPTVDSLSEASVDEVLGMWSGLGYYSRARNMHKAAQQVVKDGSFPFDIEGLRSLPGVGEYMAAAIASIALGHDEATVDGNIARVMSRLHADASPRKAMWTHARAHLPEGRAGDYNQALMDLGARVCLPRQARCESCAVSSHCEAYSLGQVDRFPPQKKKKKAPTVQMGCISVRGSGGIWLGRRPQEGLWGGLWEMPTVELSTGVENTEEHVQTWFGDEVRLVGRIRHILTHRIVDLHVFSAANSEAAGPFHYEGFRMYDPEQLDALGVSALTTKAIKLCQSLASEN